MKPLSVAVLALAAAALARAADERPVLRYVPKHEELKYTFGGAAPTHRIKPGTRIVSWSEDCFDGGLTKAGQKPSEVLQPGHDNPQTGPFYVEGAEPGDTLVIRIEKLEPARPYGFSVAFPGFGALKGTDKTAMLGPDLPETMWFYEVDRAQGRRPDAFAGRQEVLGGPARPVPGLPRRRAGIGRGALDDRAGRLRRQHGLPGGARRQHGLSRRARAGSAGFLRGRPLRHGRRRDHGHGHRRAR